MSVTISKRKLKSGNTSIYLDYYLHGERQRELLEDLILRPGETYHNKEAMRSAEMARAMKENDIASGKIGIVPAHRKRAPLLPWMEKYATGVRPSDRRMHMAVYKRFRKFTSNDNLLASAVTPSMCESFRRYLHDNHSGETPFNYWKYFKRIIKAAVEAGFFKSHPAAGIKNVNSRGNEVRKPVFFDDEINLLAKTPCGSPEVKRAFLFSTQTGLSRSDIVRLQWKHIDWDERLVIKQRKKTDVQMVIPLNGSALQLLGEPGEPNAFIFTLPTHDGTNKTLRAWAKRAGIKKRISYHCARHSLATNLLIHGENLKTVSQVLGHTTTRHTEKYTKITDAMKHRAVERLPAILFGG